MVGSRGCGGLGVEWNSDQNYTALPGDAGGRGWVGDSLGVGGVGWWESR